MERLRLLELLFFTQQPDLKVRALARSAEVSPALVSSTLAMLKHEKLVKNNAIDFQHPLARALKIMLNIEKAESLGIAKKILGLFKDCKGIGLYGSWANGTNTRESDIDLWIKTEKGADAGILQLRRFLKQKTGTEANALLLTKKRLSELKQKDFVFYCMLHNSFVLRGEGI